MTDGDPMPPPGYGAPMTPPLPGPEEMNLGQPAAGASSAGKPSTPGAGTASGAARGGASLSGEIEQLALGLSNDPHALLGAHEADGRLVVRAWVPDGADAVAVRCAGREIAAVRLHPAGLWQADLGNVGTAPAPAYRLAIRRGGGGGGTAVAEERDDPYRYWPTVGEFDLYLFGEGRHEALWRRLGAHPMTHQGTEGTAFAVWAPNARSVRVVGEWNSWDGRAHPMRNLGNSGVWEMFVPAARAGQLYKYELIDAFGHLTLRADPFAAAAEPQPGTASRVFESSHRWDDDDWMTRRASIDLIHRPFSTYEVHLGSWRRADGDRQLTYREVAPLLADYVHDMGFTHVEFLPLAEHPFGGSWGYQVTSYFAPTSRFGTPDDFRFLVDTLHQRGIGVLVDWVPAHFPKDSWALARFDGTALFEHADPRQGEHPDWGTLVFNFGRHEVANFLTASAQAWIEDFHIDGLRVDAVASMLYLDYSREAGEWVPNQFGGRENLEAVAFLQRVNELVHGRYPGVATVAEESTSWPAVSRPVYAGGLGFTFKWNMGWMHDTLDYLSHQPVHRRYHHHEMTFGLLYAFTENFVLPLSHDEVVHGKSSLLNKMPGDRWQQMANLRCLFAWMWAHPGRPLLFMGSEFAQEHEWSNEHSLDWHVLEWAQHRGIKTLVRTLNFLMAAHPALWELDFEPAGFRWVDANDADQNVLAFLRTSADGADQVACVANLAPVVRPGYRMGVPDGGLWEEILNTDAPVFSGSDVVNGPRLAEPVPWHGLEWSVELTLPPLGVIWLARVTG
ncbi:MAG: 1,4-alpha-glucan branching protein GlgB [Acidimicrobiales bacterium]